MLEPESGPGGLRLFLSRRGTLDFVLSDVETSCSRWSAWSCSNAGRLDDLLGATTATFLIAVSRHAGLDVRQARLGCSVSAGVLFSSPALSLYDTLCVQFRASALLLGSGRSGRAKPPDLGMVAECLTPEEERPDDRPD